MEHNKRSSFSGKLGYVLSAAGASVGLGNIWRFPYLAAKYGGGTFLLTYLILSVSGSKVRRRHFPADLYFAGVDLRLYHDCSGNRDWAHDEKEPGRSLFLFRQIEMAVCRRLDQCDHSCADRTVLFRNRWLGHQISG